MPWTVKMYLYFLNHFHYGDAIMPTYEYECKKCGHNFEVFQAMSDEPLKQCVKCGKEVRRLILGGAGIIFKGSGFYVTDKGRDADKGKKSAGKTGGETKPTETAQTTASPSNGDVKAGDSAASKDAVASKDALASKVATKDASTSNTKPSTKTA
jgi:putative FmdB family regulatory protein